MHKYVVSLMLFSCTLPAMKQEEKMSPVSPKLCTNALKASNAGTLIPTHRINTTSPNIHTGITAALARVNTSVLTTRPPLSPAAAHVFYGGYITQGITQSCSESESDAPKVGYHSDSSLVFVRRTQTGARMVALHIMPNARMNNRDYLSDSGDDGDCEDCTEYSSDDTW